MHKYTFDAKNVYVVPNNDLESVEICNLLRNKGYVEGENLFITSQKWGASWGSLEPEIKEKLAEFAKPVRVTEPEKMYTEFGVMYNPRGIKETVYEYGKKIYGIELAGSNDYRAMDIDHHKYYADDRSNPASSIEQVAQMENVKLSLYQQLVAANDKGYIPEMRVALAYNNFDPDSNQGKIIINDIRAKEQLAQGITQEQIDVAKQAVKNAEITPELTIVKMEHSKTSPVCDTLFGEYKNLLIISGDGETNFFGAKDIIEKLSEAIPGSWSGGDIEHNNGFWGGYGNQRNMSLAKSISTANLSSERIRKYTSIVRLHLILEQMEVEHDFLQLLDGFQIKAETWDVVEHECSIGRTYDMMEGMGTIVKCEDDVEGYLTVDEILERLAD